MEQELPKPKPPLIAYNLYFQIERKRILAGTDHLEEPITVPEILQASLEHKLKGKRSHRKTHGLIGFKELARTIAARWKKLDPETRQLLEEQAVVEKDMFARDYKSWLTKQNEAKEAATATQQQFALNSASTQELKQTMVRAVSSGTPLMVALQELREKVETEIARLAGATNNRAELLGQASAAAATQGAPYMNTLSFHEAYSIPTKTEVCDVSFAVPISRSFSDGSLVPLDWETDGIKNTNYEASSTPKCFPSSPQNYAPSAPPTLFTNSGAMLGQLHMNAGIQSLANCNNATSSSFNFDRLSQPAYVSNMTMSGLTPTNDFLGTTHEMDALFMD